MPLRSSKRGKYWEIWPRRDCRAGWSAHLHLSSATAPGLRAELLPLGSHGRSPPPDRSRREPAAHEMAPEPRHSPAPAPRGHRGTLRAPTVLRHRGTCGHLAPSGNPQWISRHPEVIPVPVDIPEPGRHPLHPADILVPCWHPWHLPCLLVSCGYPQHLTGPPSTLWAPQHLPLNPVQKYPVREPRRKDRACFSPVSLQGDKGYPGYPSTCWASWHPLGILAPSRHSDTPSGQQYLSRETLVI